MTSRLALTMTAAVLVSLAGPAAAGAHAAAPSPYSAPLRTAVRELPVEVEDNTGYNRKAQFGDGWGDADRDCQSTRHEVLITEGTGVELSARGCTVVSGRWRSFYDNKTYTSPSQLQIDHLIPVAEAWGSGAQSWSQARRVAFYNDLGVAYALNAMPVALNQDKKASGPEGWMPPANRCRYIEVWTLLKHRWGLSVDQAEQAALIGYADSCPNRTLTVPRATP